MRNWLLLIQLQKNCGITLIGNLQPFAVTVGLTNCFYHGRQFEQTYGSSIHFSFSSLVFQSYYQVV